MKLIYEYKTACFNFNFLHLIAYSLKKFKQLILIIIFILLSKIKFQFLNAISILLRLCFNLCFKRIRSSIFFIQLATLAKFA